MRSYVSLLARIAVVGGVLWLGWVWGHAETASLKAEAERALYENNEQISEPVSYTHLTLPTILLV